MALQGKFNTDNVFSRALVAGLLNVLNNEIQYDLTWSDEDREIIDIPFFYNFAGDERYIQQFYTFYPNCPQPKKIDGNFDQVPRGIITYKGSPISAQRITTRFVQGNFVKQSIEGKLETFVSYLYSIPLSPQFSIEIWVDNQLTLLKVEQAIRETFYKTKTFYFYFRGMRVGCTIGFPETYTSEKNVEFSFESKNPIKLTFDLEGETYQPVFDPTTVQPANNVMRSLGYRLHTSNEKSDGNIWITSPSTGLIVPKGLPLMINYNYIGEGAVISKVDIYYQNTGSTTWNLIKKGIDNHQYFVWAIPDDFTTFHEPQIIFEEDSSISIYRNPVIRILPDVCTGKINASSFYIIDPGYFLGPPDTSINVVLEMKDNNNNIFYTNDSQLSLNITENVLNSEYPVAYIDASLSFPDFINHSVINLIVVNSVNNDVYGTVNNITII